MIMGQMVTGPWSGSLGAYERGADFNCTTTICYGVTKQGEAKPGAVHQAFVNLQRAINRWSGKARFGAIAEDGFIGAGTVAALKKAGTAALDHLPVGVKQVAQALFTANVTKETIATNAQGLTERLNEAADRLESAGQLPPPRVAQDLPPEVQTPPTMPLPSPPGTPNPIRPDQPTVVDVSLDPAPAGKSNMLLWVLGGAAVVAAAGIGTAIVMRRRSQTTMQVRRPTRRLAGARRYR